MNGKEQRPPEAGMSRKTFLGWATAGLGAAIGAVLGGAGTGYFISPALKGEAEGWIDIGPAKDVKPGVPVKIDFTQRKRDAWAVTERRASAWVLTSNGTDFVVFDPRCTHLGCPYRWDDAAKKFLCPCHSAVFDVDGRVVKGPPPRPLDRLPVKLVGGRLLVKPEPQKGEA